MKYVRLENNIVREIIPETATVPSVAHWYGDAFAENCREAPDEVEQRWVFDPDTGAYAPAPEPEPAQDTPESDPLTDLQLAVVELYEMMLGGAEIG